jgi:hypothetical protein
MICIFFHLPNRNSFVTSKKLMKSLFDIGSTVILLAAMLSGLGCKKSDASKSNTPAFQVPIKVDPNLGKYLVDKDGRTFYFFSNDSEGKDNCMGQCKVYWPIFNVTNLTASMLGPELDFADFGSVSSPAGKPQLTTSS